MAWMPVLPTLGAKVIGMAVRNNTFIDKDFVTNVMG